MPAAHYSRRAPNSRTISIKPDATAVLRDRSEVCAGAATIESPVCTPTGSRFSIEQTVMQLSAASRKDFKFNLFPARYVAFNQCLTNKTVFQTFINDFIQFIFQRYRRAAQSMLAERSETRLCRQIHRAAIVSTMALSGIG